MARQATQPFTADIPAGRAPVRQAASNAGIMNPKGIAFLQYTLRCRLFNPPARSPPTGGENRQASGLHLVRNRYGGGAGEAWRVRPLVHASHRYRLRLPPHLLLYAFKHRPLSRAAPRGRLFSACLPLPCRHQKIRGRPGLPFNSQKGIL